MHQARRQAARRQTAPEHKPTGSSCPQDRRRRSRMAANAGRRERTGLRGSSVNGCCAGRRPRFALLSASCCCASQAPYSSAPKGVRKVAESAVGEAQEQMFGTYRDNYSHGRLNNQAQCGFGKARSIRAAYLKRVQMPARLSSTGIRNARCRRGLPATCTATAAMARTPATAHWTQWHFREADRSLQESTDLDMHSLKRTQIDACPDCGRVPIAVRNAGGAGADIHECAAIGHRAVVAERHAQ